MLVPSSRFIWACVYLLFRDCSALCSGCGEGERRVAPVPIWYSVFTLYYVTHVIAVIVILFHIWVRGVDYSFIKSLWSDRQLVSRLLVSVN